jgi:hypothetical protein
MKATKFVGRASCASAVTLALASGVQAAAVRTFVSGLGNDSNTSTNCPRTTPCRTFGMAYTVTQAGGEIIALDPAGYGPITITGPLTIAGVDGAAVAPATGTVGITITAGSTDKILIQRLKITGGGASNTTGIQLNSGNLVLQNSSLELLSTGLSVANSKADVVYTDIIGNTTGISTTGTGTDQNSNTINGPTQVRLAWGSAIDNTTAFFMSSPGTGCSGNCNNITIFQFITSNTSAAYSTNMTGNTTLVSGNGTGCTIMGNPVCTNLGVYEQTQNPH